jgi:hypothetical protein
MLNPATLTRHAVCVGQTGSGKTGLCVSILEELADAGVPIVALDPKGDLTNLGLVLPTLDAAAFRPWVDATEAARRGTTVDALAASAADAWRAGLAARGLGPEHLAAWKARVEVIVLTPGSDAGRPVDLITSLTRAPVGLDDESLRGWITGVVTSLLGLVDEPADPLTDPAAVLLAHLFGRAFAAGQDLPLDVLLPQVVTPPLDRLGIFPVDDVLPRARRQALALKLNTLLASPAFAAWRTGEPIDLDAWTRPTADGRTPVRVLVLSHLGDAERMFFTSVLLHAVVAWTRRLSGTGQLRALVYLDEAVGFLPPHPKDPPSKGPLITLLKQARAVGVGVMLATQNPVDVDHKALSNAGTWLVGRLQSDNDRERVLDALVSAHGGPTRKQLAARLTQLPARSFVVRGPDGRVTEQRSPHTRCWLRGPLTLRELTPLLPPRDGAPRARVDLPTTLSLPPPTPAGVDVRWLTSDAAAALARLPTPDAGVDWRFAVYARFHARFGSGDAVEDVELHRLLLDGRTQVAFAIDDDDLHDVAPSGGRWPHPPSRYDQRGELDRLREAWRDAVVREERLGDTALRRGDVTLGFFGIVWVPVVAA